MHPELMALADAGQGTCSSGFSVSEREAFRRDGFVIARGLATGPLLARILAIAQAQLAAQMQPVEYEADLRYPGAPASREAQGGRTVRRLLQAYGRDSTIREWATSAELAVRLRQLLGAPAVLSRVHHNCVMTKHPRFGSSTGWHQDIRYWSFERSDLVSAWLALGREHGENGCLRVIPGSHSMQLGPERFDDRVFLRQAADENRALVERGEMVELEPGDVLFFHCRLLHAAGRNRTDAVKFSAVFTYHGVDNCPLPGTRSTSLAGIPLAV